jgi:hypoxanthine phosphoribosyltransferase
MITQEHTIDPVLSPEQIQDRVAELASQLDEELRGGEPILLGVLNGAFMFLSDLVRNMSIPVQIDFCRLASYGGSTESSGQINMHKDCELDVTGRVVVVVEDIVDTGLTVNWLVKHLRARKPAALKLCSFIDKPERRTEKVDMDYVGFTVPQGFLVGYGLDYNQQYRNLPGVGELKFRS